MEHLVVMSKEGYEIMAENDRKLNSEIRDLRSKLEKYESMIEDLDVLCDIKDEEIDKLEEELVNTHCRLSELEMRHDKLLEFVRKLGIVVYG